jgi:hypothetical protein
MQRIGILLDSTRCDCYLYQTVRDLAEDDNVDLIFLVNQPDPEHTGVLSKTKSRVGARGSASFFNHLVFRVTIAIERAIVGVFNPRIKGYGKLLDIEQFNSADTVSLTPKFSASGISVSYSDQDIQRLRSLQLGLIVRGNAPGIFVGEILQVASNGIISFHHGDNRWNRGGPPAFWEVYFRKHSTGFIIQILTEDLDGGSVILRGQIATCRSYAENVVSLLNESNSYLARLVSEFALSGELPSPEEKTVFSHQILTIPAAHQSAFYFYRTATYFAKRAIERFILRRHERWSVGYIAGPWSGKSLRKGTEIANPPYRFFADPFVISKNGRTICYVEEYDFVRKKGHITAIEIFDETRYSVLGPIIDEPFHMSFPYLFEYNSELYMIPEAGESNSIRLYRCTDFPMSWEYEKDILVDTATYDSMIFENNGRWWLFTNTPSPGNDDCYSRLMIYYSSDPLSGDWVAHKLNPVVYDSDIARNAGILDINQARPVRCRQKQGFDSYGASMSLAAITELSPLSYEERELVSITPDFRPRINGCHHMHSCSDYTVYDYRRTERLK